MSGFYPSTSGSYLQLGAKNIQKSNAESLKAVFLPDYSEKYGYETMAVGKIFHNDDETKVVNHYGGKFAWMGLIPSKNLNYDPDAYSVSM